MDNAIRVAPPYQCASQVQQVAAGFEAGRKAQTRLAGIAFEVVRIGQVIGAQGRAFDVPDMDNRVNLAQHFVKRGRLAEAAG